MRAILLFSFICISTWIMVNGSIRSKSYLEDTPPDPPIYPPRWTATAEFEFINMSNNSPAGAGILYQLIDSINQKFRADDLYFAGTFPSPYDTFFSSSTPSNAYPGRSSPVGSCRIRENPTLSDGRIRRDSDSRKPVISYSFPTVSDCQIPSDSDNRHPVGSDCRILSDPIFSDCRKTSDPTISTFLSSLIAYHTIFNTFDHMIG